MKMIQLVGKIKKIIPIKVIFTFILLLSSSHAFATSASLVDILSCLQTARENCADYSKVSQTYKKLRVLVALNDYQHLQQLIQNSYQGRAPYNGIQYYFETKTSYGKSEFQKITDRFNKDIKNNNVVNLREVYKKEIADLEKEYPFVTKLKSGVFHPTVDELIHDLKIVAGVGNESITDRFFETFKQGVVAHNQEKLDTVKAVTACLQRSDCELTSELKQIYQEYRIYVALLNFKDVEMRIKQIATAHIPAHGTLIEYNTRNEKGRKEFEYIRKRYIADMDMIEEKLGFSEPETREQANALTQLKEGRQTHYKELINRYVVQYPLVSYLKKHDPDQKALASASRSVEGDYEKLVNDVKKLEGDDRFELIGFVEILEETTKKFTDEQNLLVSSYIYKMQNDATILNRIKSILSPKVIALASCHVITYYLNVPIPIVQVGRLVLGTVCSAIGIFLTADYMWDATKDLTRQMNYMITGKYSDQVMNQYIKSYVSSLIMAVLYVGPALPGLWGRATAINKFGRISLRQHRKGLLWKHNVDKMRRSRKSVRNDVQGLVKHYGEYYGEEILVNELFTAGGKMLASLAVMEGAMAKVMRAAFGRRLQIYDYASLLKATP